MSADPQRCRTYPRNHSPYSTRVCIHNMDPPRCKPALFTARTNLAKQREKIEQVWAQRTFDRVPEKFEGIRSSANDGGSGYVIYQVLRCVVYFGKRAAQCNPYHSRRSQTPFGRSASHREKYAHDSTHQVAYLGNGRLPWILLSPT